MNRTPWRTSLTLSTLLLAACGSSPRTSNDAGSSALDASMRIDASTAPVDAGAPMDPDAGPSMDPDAGAPIDTDAGAPIDTDAGPSMDPDAGPSMGTDAGASMPGSGLSAVRAAAPGMLARSLPVRGVTVTYVRPALGDDPEGFFVQADAAGPAVFVAVAPSTLTPAPVPGDVVSFDVGAVADAPPGGTMGVQRRVTSLSGYMRSGTSADLSRLTQEISTRTDVVSALDSLESELISITGQLEPTMAFAPGGTGHRRIQLTTASVADPGLVFRAPDAVITALGLRPGCEITVTAPLWRFGATAQVMGYDAADVTVLSCPPPTACAPASHLVINEIDYDQAGADNAEFVELFNPTSAAVNLAGFAVVHIDGAAGNAELGRATLTGTLAPGAFLVVATSAATSLVVPSGVTRVALTGSTSLQNGPDALVLLGPAGVVDAVAYEGPVTSARFTGSMASTALPEGMTSAGTDAGDGSLQRAPNGCDTDAPSTNFMLLSPATPGAPTR